MPHFRGTTHWYDSRPAHEAFLWAAAQGAGEAFRRGVYRAYFVQDQNIAAPEVLGEIAGALDLDAADLRRALAGGQYRDAVTEQFEEARALGVTAVPTFVVDGRALIGAYPYEAFVQLMEMTGTSRRRSR